MKIFDQIYCCQMPGQMFGVWQLQCRLRIFQSSDVQTVMITDMGFEIGWFIPYTIERLIEQIVKEFWLNPAQVIWLEHYASTSRSLNCADFSRVTFEWQNGKATNPQWIAIDPAAVQTLISGDLQLLSL